VYVGTDAACCSELRPDKCHIVFEKVTDNVVFGRLDDACVLSPWSGQLRAFNKEGFSVIICRVRRVFILVDGIPKTMLEV